MFIRCIKETTEHFKSSKRPIYSAIPIILIGYLWISNSRSAFFSSRLDISNSFPLLIFLVSVRSDSSAVILCFRSSSVLCKLSMWSQVKEIKVPLIHKQILQCDTMCYIYNFIPHIYKLLQIWKAKTNFFFIHCDFLSHFSSLPIILGKRLAW